MPAEATLDQAVRKDLKTLATFVQLYCDCQHSTSDKALVTMKTHDVAALAGRPIALCAECRKLLAHAFVKRSTCPMDPKPMCKHCPSHCYAPQYRERIQEVMRFSGRKMVLGGRVDYLLHLVT